MEKEAIKKMRKRRGASSLCPEPAHPRWCPTQSKSSWMTLDTSATSLKTFTGKLTYIPPPRPAMGLDKEISFVETVDSKAKTTRQRRLHLYELSSHRRREWRYEKKIASRLTTHPNRYL